MDKVKYFVFSSQRKFGVELEVSAHVTKKKLRDFIAEIDQKHPIKISEHNEKDYGNNHWSVKRDGSCKDLDYQYGFEIASYVGSTVDDINVVNKVTSRLLDSGVKINDNCSIHVHAEVADFTKFQLSKLVALWMKIENVMLQTVPQRRRNSFYCVPLRKHHAVLKPDNYVFNNAEDQKSFFSKIVPPIHNDKNRRVTMNICNVCSALECEKYDEFGDEDEADYDKRRTVELRLPESSLNPSDITSWIKIFVRFVSLSKQRKFPTDLSSVGLSETMTLLGLRGVGDSPFLLSKGLWNMKVWLLGRILTFGTNKTIKKEASEMLERMTNPGVTVRHKSSELKDFGESPKYGGLLYSRKNKFLPELLSANLDIN
jgi:hypothetical protein